MLQHRPSSLSLSFSPYPSISFPPLYFAVFPITDTHPTQWWQTYTSIMQKFDLKTEFLWNSLKRDSIQYTFLRIYFRMDISYKTTLLKCLRDSIAYLQPPFLTLTKIFILWSIMYLFVSGKYRVKNGGWNTPSKEWLCTSTPTKRVLCPSSSLKERLLQTSCPLHTQQISKFQHFFFYFWLNLN